VRAYPQGGAVLARRLRQLTLISAALTILAALCWLVAEAVAMAGAARLDALVQALPLVATGTRFGQTLLARVVLVLLATCAAFIPGRRGGAALAIAMMIAAALQGQFGHAGAAGGAEGDSLLVSEALHVIAAGAWLGGLLPLWLAVGLLPPPLATACCQRFTPIGLACVLVLAASGLLQALDLIGTLPALLGTPYGHIAMVKISLFAVALVLAWLNRLWLTDRLENGGSSTGLRLSIALETVIGLALVLAAGTLASTPPALHTQPVWPFSWQFSLETVDAEPDFREEVAVSALLIGLALAMLSITLIRCRMRLLALVLCLIVVYARAPSFQLLTVAAYPTSFQTSPTRFSAASILDGQALYPDHCARCHGPEGHGDGPDAAHLPIKPIDLTAAHVLWHPDGELFWWISHGIEGPDGNLAMPGVMPPLSEHDVWALIDYVRAHNVGFWSHAGEMPGQAIRAPDFPLDCGDDGGLDLADLRGRAVLLVTDSASLPAGVLALLPAGLATGQLANPTSGQASGLPASRAAGSSNAERVERTTSQQSRAEPNRDISVVAVGLRSGGRHAGLACAAASPAAWDAYAVLAGVAPSAMSGVAFLIDPNGWLRAIHWPDSAISWQTEAALLTSIRDICATPITEAAGSVHEHHH